MPSQPFLRPPVRFFLCYNDLIYFYLKILKAALINNRNVSQLSGQVKTPGDSTSNYVQGQYVENQKVREYFYFLDHHGHVNFIIKSK